MKTTAKTTAHVTARTTFDGLRQRAVLDATGVVIGEVEALLVDTSTWSADTIRVRIKRDLTGEAGIARSLFKKPVIEIPTRLVQSVGDAVLLSVELAALREHADEEPVPAPHVPT